MSSTEQNQTTTPSEQYSADELISSILDGDTAGISDEKLGAVLNSADSRQTWHRYNLIGEALRHGEQADPQASVVLGDSTTFADRVRAEILNEPTVLAPRKRSAPKYLQPIAGFALAASVAGLAVIGVQRMNQPSDQAQPLSVANISAAEQVLSGPSVANVSENSQTPELEVDLAEHQRRLNSYLVNFNAQRTSLGMPGVNPYVRIVGFESEK